MMHGQRNIKNSTSLRGISVLFTLIFRTGINELRNLQYLPRLSEAREYMFEDRTKAHADHVGHGLDRMTTAAVGECKSHMKFLTMFMFFHFQ
jgi:hypothetical protein